MSIIEKIKSWLFPPAECSVEVTRGKDNEWRWKVVDVEGSTIANQIHGYSTFDDAFDAAEETCRKISTLFS